MKGREKMSKLLEQQTVTRQKSKDIDNRISKLNGKIQEYENKALYKICKELNISVLITAEGQRESK